MTRQKLHHAATPEPGLVGIWCLFVFTLPVAYLRVSRSQTFTGTPFRSFTLEDQLFGPPAD